MLHRVTGYLRRPPLLILAGALGIAILLVVTRPSEPPVSLPERAWTVDVIEVQRGEFSPTLELYGRLESPQDAGVTAAVSGEVLEVQVRDGDTVTAGQPLLRMDDREARLTLLQREADARDIEAQIRLEQRRAARNRESLERERELLRLVERDADRALNLQRDGVLSQADVDTVTENLKRAQLALNARELAIEESEIRLSQLAAQQMRAAAIRDQAALDLERMQVNAPFDGLVSGLTVSQGDRAQAGEVLMRVHNPDSIELRVQIPTRLAFRVRDALAAGVPMPAQVELERSFYAARLERVSGQVRQGAGTVETFLALEAVPMGVAGLGATVRVVLSLPPEPDSIAVPAEALYGRDRLFKLVDGRMRSVTVERVGERLLADGRSEVLVRSSDLLPADQIIVTKLSTATDGLLVRVPEQSGGMDSPGLPGARTRLVGGGEAD
jgi:HlyD family secretion protein